MASTYRPWRYMNRDEYQEMQARAFRNNAQIQADAVRAAPPPPPTAVSSFDDLTTGKPKKSGGGLLGKVKDVAGEAAHIGKVIGENALSGEKFQDTLGIDTGYMDSLRKHGLGGRIAAAALDTITAPATVVTLPFGGAAGGAIRGATAAGRLSGAGKLIAGLVEPAVEGNIARRAVAEVGAGVGGQLAADEVTKRLPDGTPAPLRAAVGLGAGLAGGAAGLHAGRGYEAVLGPKGAVVKGLEKLQGREGRGPALGFGTEDVSGRRYGREVSVPSDVHPDTNYAFRYRVADLGDLRVSHDPFTFAENPDYIPGVQPRNRGDVASQEQVKKYARSLDANKMLAETGDLQNGVPIVGEDNIVESGNGRTMAVKRAAQEHPEQYANYVEALKGKLADFGLPEDALAGVENPILIRERVTPVPDRAAFADEANGSSTLRMGTRETARTDAAKIGDQQIANLDIPDGWTIDDVIRSPRSAGMVRAFMDALPPTERGALMDAQGVITQAGVNRLRVALFQKTYPGEAGARLLGDFFESPDPAVKNVKAGIEQSLPAMAQVEAGIRAGRIRPELSLAEDVAKAADVFRRLRAGQLRFKTVDDYLAQSGLFGGHELSATAQDILRFLDQHNRAPKQLREALRDYAAAVESLPPPGQAGMFGDALAAPDSRALWEGVTGRTVPEPVVAPDQPSMLDNAASTSETLPDASAPTSTIAGQARSEGSPAASSMGSTSEGSIPNSTDAPATASSTLPRSVAEGSQSPIGASVPPEMGNSAKLPPALGGAKPRYSFGSKKFELTFESDLDRALYIVAQQTPSRRDGDYMQWLRENLPGTSDADIRDRGKGVRERIKQMARTAEPGSMHVPDGAVGMRRVPTEPAVGINRQPGEVSAARGPEAAVGEPPIIPEELPPGPPPAEPPPPRMGTDSTPPLGSDAQPVDLLGTRSKKAVKAEAAEAATKPLAQIAQRVKSALGRLPSDEVREGVDPILREKNRIDNVIGHQVAWFVAKERATMREAGLDIAKGADDAWHLTADGKDVGLFEDVVERVSDAGRKGYDSLTPEQQAALGVVGDTNAQVNGTKGFHGAKVQMDDNILGDYFGRRVLSREYISELTGEKIKVEKGDGANLPSRKVGANRTKSRTMESIEAGMDRGIAYDNPWDTRAAIIRGKLLDAEDAYLKTNLKNLRVKKPGSTLGLEQVGHPAFNNMWFKPDVARRIRAGLDSQAKGPLKTIEAINSVLTPLRASFDLSATLQQGQRMWLTDPKHASEYWWEVVRSLKDPKVYDGMLLRLDKEGPGIAYLNERGLRFTGEGTADDFFVPEWLLNKAGKAGDIGKGVNKAFNASNQHFSRLLNAYRLHMANSQYERLVGAGFSGKELDDAMRQSVDGINRTFGWTHSKPSTLEQTLLFAPRYTRASLETLKAAISNGGIEGQMARRHMGLMLGEGAAIVWLLNEVRGYETEMDPRDPNFLRLRNVAGLDVSPFGTYNTLFRGIAQTIAGDPQGDGLPDPAAIGRFVEGKLSPAVGSAYWPLKGETYTGEPLDPTAGPEGFGKAAWEQVKSSIPFGAQNLFEDGLPTPRSVASAAVGSTGLSSSPITPAEERDIARGGSPGGVNLPLGIGHVDTTGHSKSGLAQEMFGKRYEDLTGAEKAQVNERPEVAGPQREVDERALRSGGDRGMATQIRQTVTSELAANAEYLANGRDAAGKPYTGNDFRKAYSDTMLRAAGARKLLKDFQGDADVNGWFKLYERATMPNGQIDYDQLERLQADYESAHPGVDEKVAKETGIRDNAAVRELREAKKLAKAYYDIPAYRGMTTDEAEKAGQFLALASDLVATGRARNRNHALVLLREFDATGAQLAFRANRLGANPDRKKFRQSNPLFARYFYDTVPLSQVA